MARKGRPYNRTQMKEALKRAYPDLFVEDSEGFDGVEGGIWIAADSGILDKKGIELFDYYGSHSLYELGVVRHLDAYVQRHGWYFEWNDPGTIFLWRD